MDEWVARVQSLPYFNRRCVIARLVQPGLSRFLYKYRSVDPSAADSINRLKDTLVRSRLWLSSPMDFNDPFDVSAKVVASGTPKERRDRLDDWLKQQRLPWKERKRQLREHMKEPVEEFEKKLSIAFRKGQEDVGVFSFAGNPRDILMWSHYAKDHTGICIQFERARDLKVLSHAVPVKYSADYPIVNWFKNFPTSLGIMMLQKHEGWAYEQEQRMVFPGFARKFRQFDPAAVIGIIFGCRCSELIRESVLDVLKERKAAGLPDVKLYRALKNDSKYQIDIYK